MMYLKITSLKLLYHLIQTGQVRPSSVFLICATETPLRPELLNGFRYLHIPFRDVEGQVEGAFTAAMANRIAAFFHQTDENDYRVLYICCDRGQSRSAAIAAAILRYCGGDDVGEIWERADKYAPNPYVYRLQCQAFGISVNDRQAKQLQRRNKRQFKRLIRQGQT